MNKTQPFLKIFLLMTMFCSLASCKANTASPLLPPEDFNKYVFENREDLCLLDVRTPQEFVQGYIPGAINIDAEESIFVEAVKARIPKEKKLAVYCRSGRRSADAAQKLVAAGYDVTDLDGGILAWQEADLPLTNGKEDLYITPGGMQIEIQSLIHASVRIVFEGKEIEIDPVGKMGDRETDYASFPKAALILITHEHYDHLDPEAVKTLSGPYTIVIANPNSANILVYGKIMKNGDTFMPIKGITVEAVPAYNTSADKLQFHPKGRDNGYILTLDGFRIYIAGDTEVIPEMESFKDIDIAFLPCNLPYTMTPAQLIEAAKIIKPKVVYPYHYGTTDLSSVPEALIPLGIDVRILPFDPGAH